VPAAYVPVLLAMGDWYSGYARIFIFAFSEQSILRAGQARSAPPFRRTGLIADCCRSTSAAGMIRSGARAAVNAGCACSRH